MLKEQIQNLIMQQLNQNSQNVLFKLGKLGQTNASTFVIERYGTEPNENWYDVITEEFVPVVVNNFDAVYLFDNQFKRRTFVGQFSFLVKQEQQSDVLEAIDTFIENLIGTTSVIDGFRLFFDLQDIRFVNTLVLNDIKFLEFELPITVQAAEGAFFGASYAISIKKPADQSYIPLNIINYVPVRSNQTVPVQKVGDNSSKSIVQASAWNATLEFYIRTESFYTSTIINSLINQLENSALAMNQIYNLRVYNPYTNTNYDKNVIVSSITTPVQRQNIVIMTITLEEANTEVI